MESATAAPPVDRVLETPVKLLRTLWAWPDVNRRPILATVTRYVVSGAVSLINLTSLLYIAFGEYDGVVSVMSSVGDVVAGIVILVKIDCIFSHGKEMRLVRDLLQHSFRPIEEELAAQESREASTRILKEAHSICRWVLLFYIGPSVSGIVVIVANGLLGREKRQLFFKAPSFVTQSDPLFWLITTCTFILLSTFPFISGGFDTLFLSLCMHIRSKCFVLQRLFRHACQKEGGPGSRDEYEHWENDGSGVGPALTEATARTPAAVGEALKSCAVYHQLVIKLRDTTENVYANVTLVLMGYLLLGLGIPGLRVLYDKSMDASAVIFLLMYTSWNFSQLLFYCWFADTVARSSTEVSVAAYSALRPDMPGGPLSGLAGGAAATLNLVTLRAQKPLYLTAGRLIALTLELYLEIMRRSQSIYSYLLRLR